jgi:mobilome CxxCx(11)CxxC protein
VSVPVAYFLIRYFAKGTSSQFVADVVWEVLAMVLLIAAITKIVYKWQERAERHSTLLGENLALVRHADSILSATNPSVDRVQAYLELADRIEADDTELLEDVTVQEKQAAYRDALKQFDVSNVAVICRICGASPWQFTPGSCVVCGNTPAGRPARQPKIGGDNG